MKAVDLKESPVSMVARMFVRHQLVTRLVAKGQPFSPTELFDLKEKVEQLCKEKNIGNPFEGEAI